MCVVVCAGFLTERPAVLVVRHTWPRKVVLVDHSELGLGCKQIRLAVLMLCYFPKVGFC